MSKCPHCGSEIDHLDYHETKTYSCEVELVDGGLVHSDESLDMDDTGYACPSCNEDVCKDDGQAIEFLKGGA